MNGDKVDRLMDAGEKLNDAQLSLRSACARLTGGDLTIQGARARRKIENAMRILSSVQNEVDERTEAATIVMR